MSPRSRPGSRNRRAPLLACIFAIAALELARPAPARLDGPDCALPPTDAWGSGSTSMNGGATFDTSYIGAWSASQAQIDLMWNGLEMLAGDWDEGWGFGSAGNLALPLSRLLNAAYVVRLVEDYSKIPGFGLWRGVSNIPEQRFAEGQYWAFATEWGADEWEPSCENGDAVASHKQTTDEWNTMHIPGSYRYEAVNRGSTIVHETTHQEVSHIGSSGCIPPSESCDAYYSDFNANTMQLNFLHDGVLTYRVAQGTDGPVRRVLRTGGQCSLWPRFGQTERTLMMARVNDVMDRFQGGPPGGWKFMLNVQVGQVMNAESFPCASCSLPNYTFNPSVCAQNACNEVLNPINVSVNANNRAVCQAYNVALAGSLTEESVAVALDDFSDGLKGCGGPQQAQAAAYCDAEKAGANHVSQVDECGWLENTYGLVTSKLKCVKQFCQAKFQSNPDAGWKDGDDSFGCLDYLCAGPACGDGSERDKCVLEFLMTEGSSFGHVAQCEWKGCQRVLLDCLLPLWQGGQWHVGDPIPQQCELEVAICQITSKLAGLVLVNTNPFLDPGPLRDLINPALARNPSVGVFEYAAEIRRRASAGAGDEELQMLTQEFTAKPEVVSALFQLMPQHFVWLYGSEGFAGLLPPSVRHVAPRAIESSMLNAEGRAALAAFLEKLATLPPGGARGTIGSFQRGR